jgi:hypothetical protein
MIPNVYTGWTMMLISPFGGAAQYQVKSNDAHGRIQVLMDNPEDEKPEKERPWCRQWCQAAQKDAQGNWRCTEIPLWTQWCENKYWPDHYAQRMGMMEQHPIANPDDCAYFRKCEISFRLPCPECTFHTKMEKKGQPDWFVIKGREITATCTTEERARAIAREQGGRAFSWGEGAG